MDKCNKCKNKKKCKSCKNKIKKFPFKPLVLHFYFEEIDRELEKDELSNLDYDLFENKEENNLLE